MARIIHFFKLVLINLFTFLILLVIVNWGCGLYLKKFVQASRDVLPNYKTDQAYAKNIFQDYNSVQHQYEPFVGWKTLPYEGKTLHINKQGLRTHLTPFVSDSTNQIVRFFGGSTMWGEGSDDQHTIPALFNAKNSMYQVFNHAQLAYNTRQELDALISLYSLSEKSDLVIFYDGVNDAAFLCPTEIEELPAHRLVPMFRQKLYVQKSVFVKEVAMKVFAENLIKVVQRFSDSPKNRASLYNCISDPQKAEEIASIFISNWELAHEIVTERGGKFIAILQPAAFIGNPNTSHLKLDSELGKNFSEVYRLIKQKIAERKYDWVYDFSDDFNGKDYIYIDFCHVSSNGNEIIANHLSKILVSVIQEDQNKSESH